MTDVKMWKSKEVAHECVTDVKSRPFPSLAKSKKAIDVICCQYKIEAISLVAMRSKGL